MRYLEANTHLKQELRRAGYASRPEHQGIIAVMNKLDAGAVTAVEYAKAWFALADACKSGQNGRRRWKRCKQHGSGLWKCAGNTEASLVEGRWPPRERLLPRLFHGEK